MREALTPEELDELRKQIHYAVYTQFGELPQRQRALGISNVLKMWIEDLLTTRVQGTPDHMKRKQ